MKQTILMLQGPPGCGKTTLANDMITDAPGTWVRVNKDDIRAELAADGIGWSRVNEAKLVVPRRDERILGALKAGKSVIVDDTNLAGDHELRLRALAVWSNCEFVVRRIDMSLEECIRRDAARFKPVGEAVVRRHYKDYERIVRATTSFTPRPVVTVPGLPDVLICDLDGTLADHQGRRGVYDFAKCADDALKVPTWHVLKAMSQYSIDPWPPFIFYMSGREEKYRPETEAFLVKHQAPKGPLYMRATGDNRSDAIVKSELFDQHVRGKYNVLLCLDDRDRVVAAWRSMGLTCWQVAPGAF